MRTLILIPILLALLAPLTTAEDELPDFDKLWNYAKPAETEKQFRELLPKAVAAGDLDYELQLRTQIARTLGMRKKFEEAHKELDEVEKRLTEEVPVAHARYLLERGRAFNSSKKKDKARPLFEKAWAVALKAKADFHAIDAAHMIGIVVPVEEKLAWHEKAMALAEKTEDESARGWLGPLYNNLGWAYFEMKDYEKALEIHEKGLAYREKVGSEKPILIARWSVARMLRALERYDEAMKIQEALLKAYEEREEEDGFVYEEIAELLLVTKGEGEARPWFKKAWAKLADSWIKDHEPERHARLKKLAEAE